MEQVTTRREQIKQAAMEQAANLAAAEQAARHAAAEQAAREKAVREAAAKEKAAVQVAREKAAEQAAKLVAARQLVKQAAVEQAAARRRLLEEASAQRQQAQHAMAKHLQQHSAMTPSMRQRQLQTNGNGTMFKSRRGAETHACSQQALDQSAMWRQSRKSAIDATQHMLMQTAMDQAVEAAELSNSICGFLETLVPKQRAASHVQNRVEAAPIITPLKAWC